MKTWILALLTVSVAFAGCAGDNGADENGVVEGKISDDDKDGALAVGKGAIEGLLVDDAFRPLELTENPQSQYQFDGFIFIQELALEVKTNENGEFTILDIEPGTYRMRPQVDGHDGKTQRVTVTEGEFTEVQIIVQRKVSDSGTVITDEFAGFTPCAVPFLVFNCLDASGDSYRPGPENIDYTSFANVTYMVIEMRTNEEGAYMFQARNSAETRVYGSASTGGGNYAKAILYNDELVTDPIEGATPWTNNENMEIILFIEDESVHLATRSQFMVSLFIEEPELDLNQYAVIADDQAT